MKDFADLVGDITAELATDEGRQRAISRNAKSMARLEATWRAVSEKLDGIPESGDALAIFHEIKAMHSRMDAFAARAINLPMPSTRSGER